MTSQQPQTRELQHSDRCQRESTRDVIFLFQIRQLTWTGHLPSYCEIDEDNNVLDTRAGKGCREPITLAELLNKHGSEYVAESWRTIGVWLDRTEAESWGETQRHNYGEKFSGRAIQDRCWQVYGVPSEGELASILRGESLSDLTADLADTKRQLASLQNAANIARNKCGQFCKADFTDYDNGYGYRLMLQIFEALKDVTTIDESVNERSSRLLKERDNPPAPGIIAKMQEKQAALETQLREAWEKIQPLQWQSAEYRKALESLLEAVEIDGSLLHSEACGCETCEPIANARRVIKNAALSTSPTECERLRDVSNSLIEGCRAYFRSHSFIEGVHVSSDEATTDFRLAIAEAVAALSPSSEAKAE